MLIRQATHSDLQSLSQLIIKGDRYHEDLNPYFRVNRTDNQLVQEIKTWINNDQYTVLVADESGTLCGCILGMIINNKSRPGSPKKGYISDLYINTQKRGGGLGNVLVVQVLNWFKDNGITRIQIQVMAGNDAAYSLYRKQGFEDYMISMIRNESI